MIYFFLSGVRFTVHRVLCRESWREVRHRRCPFFRKTFGGASLTNADSEVSIAEWQVTVSSRQPLVSLYRIGYDQRLLSRIRIEQPIWQDP